MTRDELNTQVKEIPLTKNKVAIVDFDDYEYLSQWKWRFHKGYAVRSVFIGKSNNKKKYNIIHMHRLINNTPDGILTDHINGDKLDNRKANLRNCNKAQNRANSKKNLLLTSKYKGVSFLKRDNNFIARIKVGKKIFHLGSSKDEKEMAKLYNEAAIKYFGEFACLNIIEEN